MGIARLSKVAPTNVADSQTGMCRAFGKAPRARGQAARAGTPPSNLLFEMSLEDGLLPPVAVRDRCVFGLRRTARVAWSG